MSLAKYLIALLLIGLFGKLTEENILFPRFNDSYVQRFQRIYTGKEKALNQVMLELAKIVKDNHTTFPESANLLDFTGLLSKDGLAVFVYQDDSLVFWSDNTIPIASRFSKSNIDSSFVYLHNAWYVPMVMSIHKVKIVGLIQIKQVYPFENKYLVNRFQKDFNFPASVKISTRPLPHSFQIFNAKGRDVFSLVFDSSSHHLLYQTYIPSFSYFLFILIFCWFVYKLMGVIRNRIWKNIAVLVVLLMLPALRYISMIHTFPEVFYNLDLFMPQYYATSNLLPSLGDLLIWVVVIFFQVFIFYKEFSLPDTHPVFVRKRWMGFSLLGIYILAILGFFTYVFSQIQSIILNSTISFEVNKLLTFDFYSLVGYIIILLLFASFVFLYDKILGLFIKEVTFKQFNILFIVLSFFWFTLFWYIEGNLHIESFLFVIIFSLIYSYRHYFIKSAYQFATILMVALFAIYTVYIVTRFSLKKNLDQKVVLITNLANEHDPIAEYLLRDIDRNLHQDTFIMHQLESRNLNIDRIYRYLKDRYFNAYFDGYNIENLTVCGPSDSVYLVPPDNVYKQCYSFFRSTMAKGTKIPDTHFYYIDNYDGRIFYLGNIEFDDLTNNKQLTLFIGLQSKLLSEELGYPELLLDQRFNFRSKLKEFSYAKYYKGQLISEYGSYSYNLSSAAFERARGEYTILSFDNQDHLVYRPSKDSLIVMSYPSVTFLDVLISFSYTFLFYGLVLTLILLISNLSVVKAGFQSTFKNNIQYSMMLVLFLSIILVGGGNLYYNVKQYYNKHTDIISDKLQSIYNELLSRIGHEQTLQGNWHSFSYNSLNEALVRLSNIFYIDINLYNTHGDLIATSRPEIFEKNLIGTKMNPEAYQLLIHDMKPELVHNEKIGGLNYLSAYAPIKNYDNHLVAFLNLPYFTHQEDLTREISAMVVTAVNIYVLLLMLTFLIAVILARKITLPLRVIQTRFSELKLGQKYEKIEYHSNDEIGGLVNEYNRMVSELERSVNLLARSERESAWREMAKQIAHEINNPLTPMKLSVQHLHRAWIDKNERFEEYLERITQTLIDEIDNLSAIATEFSNFAKMPTAINQEIELITKITNAVNLFSNNNVDFQLNLNGLSRVPVYADKEQASRVFINLFKNAIQSVEKGVRPLIRINVNCKEPFVIIQISDNGKGIPREIQEKLFRPNFTTKTSGMGLGLAIVKNIIDSAGGNITYTTVENKGTTFIITFPLFGKPTYS